MFGLDPDTVRNIKQVFAKIPAINKVVLYGSRAKDNYRNGSDIDITLFGKNLALDNSVYPLMGELEELNLPYMFDISIFADIDNNDLIEHIYRVGKVFYQREKGLPDGWVVKRLGDVCEVIAGQSPEGKYYNSEENGLPFYQGKKEFTEKHIGKPTKWTTKITKEAKENDILMSVRAPVGPVNFSTQKICIGRGLAAIRANELIDPEFLFNFLLKHENEIIGNTGAVFNSINKKQIEYIEIPLPPLPEQKRIVAILDQAFTAIDKAKANTEQNLKNAREVFQSTLQTIFDNGKLKIENGEWEEKKLGEVCGFFNGFAFKSKDSIDDSNTQVIRMGNLYQNKINLDRNPAFYPDNFTAEYTKYLLKENDLIISLTGTTGKKDYGYTVKVPKTKRYLLLNQRIAKFIIKNEKIINRDFLFHFLLSKTFLDELYQIANGTRQANLSTETMKGLSISFPSLIEQQKIVKKLDAISTETKKLETIYQQKITDLDELKKSILQKIFNGEL